MMGRCARRIAVSMSRKFAESGVYVVLYPLSVSRYFIGILEPANSSDSFENSLRATPGSPIDGVAGGAKALGPGSTVMVFPYGLGLKTRGIRTAHEGVADAEILRVKSSAVIADDVAPCFSGPDRELVAEVYYRSTDSEAIADSSYHVVSSGTEQYRGAFERLKFEIRTGNTYQAVISSQATIAFEEGWGSHFSSVMGCGSGRLMPYLYHGPNGLFYGSSIVPHLRVRGSTASTTVVAGTLSDLSDSSSHTSRHEAEHLMLVDLERNDLGAISTSDGVQVGKLLTPQVLGKSKYLTTTVKAEIEDGSSLLRAMLCNFPRSVVTGGPKIRTMQIIDDLEQRARGYYGGALGIVNPAGTTVDSLTILGCVIVVGDNGLIPTGGGVTIASSLENELQEIESKRKVLLR